MKKLIIFIFFILEWNQSVDATVTILTPQEKPQKFAHLKGCYVPDLDRMLRYDKPYSPRDGNNCIQYTCNKDGSTLIFSCGAKAAKKGCKIVPGNKYFAYPKCCDRIKCKKQPIPYPADNLPDKNLNYPQIINYPVDSLQPVPPSSPSRVPHRRQKRLTCANPEDDTASVGTDSRRVPSFIPRCPPYKPPVKKPPVIDPPVEDPPVENPPVTDPPVKDPCDVPHKSNCPPGEICPDAGINPKCYGPPVTEPPVEDSPDTDPPVKDPPCSVPPKPKCPHGMICLDDPVETVCS